MLMRNVSRRSFPTTFKLEAHYVEFLGVTIAVFISLCKPRLRRHYELSTHLALSLSDSTLHNAHTNSLSSLLAKEESKKKADNGASIKSKLSGD